MHPKTQKSSALFVIFTTVLIDLIGFGMVIPLIGLYGRHYGATSLELSILGGIFSLMQFLFAPFWGHLSDRFGRRPILILSLVGSSFSYALFGLASSLPMLIFSRAIAGLFTANISTAQAYIADITTKEDRAKGMGLIGAAFGIGFTFGPVLGGLSTKFISLSAPGFIAAGICGANALLAFMRLEESLPPEKRSKKGRSLIPLDPRLLTSLLRYPDLGRYFLIFFGITLAFACMEQTLSLLFQTKFTLATSDAAYHTALVLMVSGLLGASIQGGLIRILVPRFGEMKLLTVGLFSNACAFFLFPLGPNFASYFALILPMAMGSGCVNPSINALISKAAPPEEQGITIGFAQSLSALARTIGPFIGLSAFSVHYAYSFWIASTINALLLLFWLMPKKLSLQTSPSHELS